MPIWLNICIPRQASQLIRPKYHQSCTLSLVSGQMLLLPYGFQSVRSHRRKSTIFALPTTTLTSNICPAFNTVDWSRFSHQNLLFNCIHAPINLAETPVNIFISFIVNLRKFIFSSSILNFFIDLYIAHNAPRL